MKDLRKACVGEVFDYGMLMYQLRKLKAPHRKVTTLLKAGDILRIKKGLYVFGEAYRQNPIHLGLLANLIYGPSYVSQEYALYWHGLIPERVDMITSMTTGRNKLFQTPVGVFHYQYLNAERFTVGVDWQLLDNEQHFLLASPEKALADTLSTMTDIKSTMEMRLHLIENLRIDEEMLRNLNLERLKKINMAYRRPIIKLLYKTLFEGI